MTLASDLLPAPAATRLRRPTWRDPRLLVGVLLVLASVALGARLVAAADDTTPVWAARGTLPVGAPLTADTLRVVRVRLDGAAGYLPATRAPAAGLVAVRVVGAGELVPASAVAQAAELALRPVVVPVTPPLAEGLRAGARVDVWVSRAVEAGGVGPAERVVEGADVRAVTTDAGALAASAAAGAEILLAPDQLPVVLDALAGGATISLVPVPGSAPPQADR